MKPYSTYENTTKEAINEVWILVSAGMIFFMQVGFALVECGSVRKKNASTILVKNIYTILVGVITYWTVGYGLSFNVAGSATLIGNRPENFASSGFED